MAICKNFIKIIICYSVLQVTVLLVFHNNFIGSFRFFCSIKVFASIGVRAKKFWEGGR